MRTIEETIKSPAYQAYQVLHWGFVLAPLIAGVDKPCATLGFALARWLFGGWPCSSSTIPRKPPAFDVLLDGQKDPVRSLKWIGRCGREA